MGSLTWFLDIFFAPLCCNCAEEGTWLCNICLCTLKREGLTVHAEGFLFVYFLEEGCVREVIHLLKYGGVTEPLRKLIRQCPQLPWQGCCFIPVPVSMGRKKERGYNQAEVIAQELAFQCGGFVSSELLGKHERTSLVGKNRHERKIQAGEQFYWKGKSPPGAASYVVVDDVLTTGSTMGACIALLKVHGIEAEGFALAHER
jgi:predicted amidophosphoribosyltransferase